MAPNYPSAFEGRAVAKNNKGEYDAAICDYDEAIKFLPTRARTYVGRAETFRQKKDFIRALDDCNTAIRLDPETAHWFVVRGTIWRDLVSWKKAIADYSEAIRLDSKYELAYTWRGKAWFDLEDYDLAIADFDKSAELNPKNAEIYLLRGNCWVRKGEWDKGLIEYSKALEVNPDHPTALGNRAAIWLYSGEYTKAYSDFCKALELSPRNEINLSGRAALLAACPDAMFRDGKRAVEDAKMSCELTKWQLPDSMSDLAVAYAEIGDFDKAIKWEKQALEQLKVKGGLDTFNGKKKLALFRQKKPYRLMPQNPLECELARAVTWSKKGEWHKAMGVCNSVIQIDPKYHRGYSLRATLWHKKDWDKAIIDYNKALELYPEDSWTLGNRGETFIGMGEWDKARKDFARAIELDPEQPVLLTRFALLKAACPEAKYRDGKSALAYALDSYKLDPNRNARMISNVACAYAECGRFEDAVTWQRVAIDLVKSEKQLDDFEALKRLQLFEQNKPYRFPDSFCRDGIDDRQDGEK